MKMKNQAKHKTKMMILSVTIISIFFISLMSTVLSDDKNSVDFLKLGWYDVEPWEIAVCSQDFGMTETEGSGFDPGEAVQLDLFSGETILTIQAEKSPVLPDNTTTASISWYVQPISTTVNFEVTVRRGDSPLWEVIESGSATVTSGYNGFYTENKNPAEDIKEAKLYLEEGDVTLIVPAVGEEEE